MYRRGAFVNLEQLLREDFWKVSNSCFVKTLSLMLTLKDQVKEVVELSKKLPQTGPNAVECVNEAVDTLTRYYTEFPQNIVECSKL